MGTILTSRRSVLGGLVAALAAPAVVRAGSLMPVRKPAVLDEWVCVSGGQVNSFGESLSAMRWRALDNGLTEFVFGDGRREVVWIQSEPFVGRIPTIFSPEG